MPSHEGNEVSFEVESIDTTVEADATQTPPQPAPTVEPELPHPSLPMGRFLSLLLLLQDPLICDV